MKLKKKKIQKKNKKWNSFQNKKQEVNLFYVAITRAKFKLLDKSENKINDTASQKK